MSQLKTLNLTQTLRVWKAKYLPSGDTVEDQAQWIRTWIIVMVLLFFSIGILSSAPESQSAARDSSREPTLQELIPAGHLLVPIEPVNAEALDSVMDQHGLVDLFATGAGASRGRIVMSEAALVRAPKNPRQFAIIVAEQAVTTALLENLTQPLYAVLRSESGDRTSSQRRGRKLGTEDAENSRSGIKRSRLGSRRRSTSNFGRVQIVTEAVDLDSQSERSESTESSESDHSKGEVL